MTKRLILSHDLGTSGDKASLYTLSGDLVASATVSYTTQYSNQGTFAEQNPHDWWNAVCSSTCQIMHGRDPASVAAMAFSGQMMGCLCIDKNGQPLTNSIIWQDSRAAKEADILVDRIGGMQTACRLIGQPPAANYTLAKLMWIKTNRPDIYKNTYKVLAAKDYIVFRITGQMVTDHSDAAFMQAYDMNTQSWSADLMRAAGVEGTIFPRILASTDIVGEVTTQAGQALGIAAGIPVVAGAGDGPCAALGAGAVQKGDSYACVGTSTWLSSLTDQYTPDLKGKLQLYPSAQKGLYCIAGTMQGGGLTYNWARKQFCSEDTPYSEINKLISQSPPGAGGVLFLPYLMGERSPWWNAKARGVFIGMSGQTAKQDMLRAVLEGVAMNMELIRNDICATGGFGSKMNMIGGGAKGGVWRQIFADIFSVSVQKTKTVEQATSFGAAMIAAVGIGAVASLTQAKKLVQIDAANKPIPENTALYKQILPLFRDTYLALAPIFERMIK